MKKCTKCTEVKPLTQFYRSANRKDGHQSQCKPCCDEANKKCRDSDRKRYNGYRADWKRALTKRINKWKAEHGCYHCGEREACCLELHHSDPTQKENHPSLLRTSWERYIKEAEKCIVVCSNCHKKIHSGKLPFIKGSSIVSP